MRPFLRGGHGSRPPTRDEKPSVALGVEPGHGKPRVHVRGGPLDTVGACIRIVNADSRGSPTGLLRTPFSPVDRAGFPVSDDSRGPRRECRISRSPASSAPSTPPFPHAFIPRRSRRYCFISCVSRTPPFLSFPLPTGSNPSQDVPRGLTTCRFGTQQRWLAPKNSRASSSNPIPQRNAATRSAVLTSTVAQPPTNAPSSSISSSAPFEPSSATALATRHQLRLRHGPARSQDLPKREAIHERACAPPPRGHPG